MPKLRNDSRLTFTGKDIGLRRNEERDFTPEEMEDPAVKRAVRMGRLTVIAQDPVPTGTKRR